MSEANGKWSQAIVAGKTVDVYEPPEPADPTRVVLHLHGHSLLTLNGSAAFTTELARHGMYAVCPHGERSWWLDTLCSEFDTNITPLAYLRREVVPFIEQRWNVAPPKIALMGISMGGQGALQLAYRYARDFPVVAAISPAVDFHNWHGLGLPLDEMFANREAARQQTALLHLHPLAWPPHQLLVCDPADEHWFESAERLASKLSSSGIPFEYDFTTSQGGHCWAYFESQAARVLQFLVDGLEQHRRRLV